MAEEAESNQTLVKKIDEKEQQYTYKGSVLSESRQREYLWSERACIIFFYLHPFMGSQNLDVTASIFTANRTTLKGWLSKKDMLLRWLPIVEKLDGVSVKNAIPKKFVHRFNAPDSRYSSKYVKLNSHQNRIQEDKKQMKLCVVKSGFDR